MSQQVEELVRSGQRRNLMSTTIPKKASTTSAETRMGILVESGATPLTLKRHGSTAMFPDVSQSQQKMIQRKGGDPKQ